MLARWLATQPRLLILDEPTRGIDVGAKAEIEKLIASLREQGMAILFICSELEEVVRDLPIACIVLRDRAKVGELRGEAINEQNIMHADCERQTARRSRHGFRGTPAVATVLTGPSGLRLALLLLFNFFHAGLLRFGDARGRLYGS